MTSERRAVVRRLPLLLLAAVACTGGTELSCDPTLSCSYARSPGGDSLFDMTAWTSCMEQMDCEARRLGLGDRHTCVAVRDEIYCWGDDSSMQVAEPEREVADRLEPSNRVEPGEFEGVFGGRGATCAVSARELPFGDEVLDNVRCWGADRAVVAPMGATIGDPEHHFVALSLSPLGFTLGAAHGCNRQRADDAGSDVFVQCWGANDRGQVTGTPGPSAAPTMVPGVGSPDRIAAGDAFTCAIVDGQVWCWGVQPGDATAPSTPRRIDGIDDAVEIVAGAGHACAIHRLTGEVSCWGENAFGQLGDGTRESRIDAVRITGLSDVSSLAAGGRTDGDVVTGHTCAVVEGRSLRCWGRGTEGQLGLGTTEDALAPAELDATPFVFDGITRIDAVDAGGAHTCAIVADGHLFCWGENTTGQVGAGAPIGNPMLVPYMVPGFVRDDDPDRGRRE